MHKYGNVMITYGCHLHHGMTLPPLLYFGLQDLYASIMPRGHEDQGRQQKVFFTDRRRRKVTMEKDLTSTA